MTRPLTVLHIEAGRNVYGGPRQVAYLIEGLAEQGVRNLLVCPPENQLTSTLKGGDCLPLPMRGDLDWRLVGRLRRLIRLHKPDLVHVHSRRGVDWFGGWAAKLEGVPAVLSRRVDNRESWPAVRWKYPLYRRVITISQAIRQVLLSQGVPAQQMICVPDAVASAPVTVPLSRAAVAVALGLPENARWLAMAAQFIERKGHRYLLDAIPVVLARHPDARFVLFGQGPLWEEIAAQVKARGLTEHVYLPGFRTDLPALLPHFYGLVHPATREGLGVALLEAAALGVPIVATAAGGIPEAVRDQINGLLVPPADVVALAAALNHLLDDPNLAARLGAGGRALVNREFSVSAMVEGHLAIYRQILARTPSAHTTNSGAG